MPAPTRPQIEAAVTLPTYLVEYWSGSAWTTVASAYVLGVDGLNNAGGGSSGLDFGASAQPRLTIKLEDNSTTAAIAWTKTRVRVSYGFDTSTLLVRMTGIIAERSRSYGDVPTIEWTAAGFDELIKDTPMYSNLLYRRPPATATTVASIEDPANGGYQGGLVNYIFWQAGGRPLAQAGSYPNAAFYYTCQAAMITPEWTWIAGENAWSELDRLCRAIGGQVYQQPDGTMVFVNVLAATASGYTLDPSKFNSAEERASTGEYFTTARCSYTARALQPTQIVYEDTTPRLLAPSGSVTFTIEPTLPVYVWTVGGTNTVPSECYVATDMYGRKVTPTVSYTSRAAARATITITNTDSTRVIVVSKISLKGQPIAPIETGQASYGSGTPEKSIGDGEIYVQSRTHAERLCRIYADVYGVVRPTRSLKTLGYDPDRTIGEVITLTLSDWSLSAVNHRINEIAPADTGATMDLAVVPITGIPLLTDLWIVDTSYISTDSRKFGY